MRELLTEKEDRFKIYDGDTIYISIDEYSRYKEIIFEDDRLLRYATCLSGVCADYHGDRNMCYARLKNPLIDDNHFDLLKQYDELKWLVKYLEVYRVINGGNQGI
jgi:hypothetical protein